MPCGKPAYPAVAQAPALKRIPYFERGVVEPEQRAIAGIEQDKRLVDLKSPRGSRRSGGFYARHNF